MGGCWSACTNCCPRGLEGLPVTPATSILQTESDHSLFIEAGQEPVVLLVSPRGLAHRHWPQGWPRPLQLERAIYDIENAIEAAGLRHANRGWLNVKSPLAEQLPEDWSSSSTMTRDRVESAFSNLVVSAGLSQSTTQVALGEAAGALLLVREVLHHLGFQGCIHDS